MSLKQRLLHLLQKSAAEQQKPFCFMHIGKVGGQAICRELFGRFEARETLNASPEQMDKFSPKEIAKHKLILGHWSYMHIEKLPKSRFLFSMVRDPVDRILSNYWFLRSYTGQINETNKDMIAFARKYDLADFLEQKNPQVGSVIENHQTLFFAGDWRAKDNRSNPAHLENAIEHLSEFDFIGIQEQYEVSLQTLCYLMNWHPWPTENKINVTPSRTKVSDLSPAIRKRIEELNSLDIALYQKIRENFESSYPKASRQLVSTNYLAHRANRKINLPNKVKIYFSNVVIGNGWHAKENNTRWLGPHTEATVYIDVNRKKSLQLKIEIHDWTSKPAVDNLKLLVDNHQCRLIDYKKSTDHTKRKPIITKKWLIPADPIDNNNVGLHITLQVDRTELIYPNDKSQSNLLGSVAIHTIIVTPSETSTNNSDLLKSGINQLHSANSRVSEIVSAYQKFIQASENNPSDPNVWFWRAEALCYQGRGAEAISDLEKCKELSELGLYPRLDPHLESRLYERLGEALMMNDQLDSAVPHLEKAISLKPATGNERYRLNAATYMLDGIKKVNMSSVGKRMSKWPVPLSNFHNLDQLISSSILSGMKPESLITSTSNVVTFGSCFAQNIAHALKKLGVDAFCLGFGELINSTFANRALMELIAGEKNTSFEPDVPNVLATFFGSDFSAVAKRIKSADILILTLGVASAFFDKESGLFHLASPNTNTFHLTKTKYFRTTTVDENVENIQYIIKTINKLNPDCRIVFTVSPVPLYATFEYNSAIIADCVSKSTLRVAIDAIIKNHPDLLYWPAFEIIRWVGAYHGPMYGAEDGTSRHISESAINSIMRAFIMNYGDDNLKNNMATNMTSEKNDRPLSGWSTPTEAVS